MDPKTGLFHKPVEENVNIFGEKGPEKITIIWTRKAAYSFKEIEPFKIRFTSVGHNPFCNTCHKVANKRNLSNFPEFTLSTKALRKLY